MLVELDSHYLEKENIRRGLRIHTGVRKDSATNLALAFNFCYD